MAAQPNASTSPIIERDASAPFAYLSTPLAALDLQPGLVSCAQFCQHVQSLAQYLPEHPYAINLCENRYLFTVVFCAVLVRSQTNLLPPNKANNTLLSLAEQHPSYVIHDGSLEYSLTNNTPKVDLSQLVPGLAPFTSTSLPRVTNHHIAAICFTSGSTGQSQPIVKTWGTLSAANHHNARFMLSDLSQTTYQIATVPGQHMWGLETTVLMPLVADTVMSDAKPFYPSDIAGLAAQLPKPRLLVSAPIHLRALVNAGLALPACERILCATAPLPQVLASQVEHSLQGKVAEVYGCSEMGSMAVRFTAESQTWRLFDAFALNQLQTGHSQATASHIDQSVVLGDFLELVDEHHFRLTGRTDDVVNIAGKRGSLAEINRILLQYEGLEDGVAFLPPNKKRLAALVILKPGHTTQGLADYFREHIDPAFVPRPMVAVPQLPRSENGKLSHKAVLDCYQRTRPT
ncbi:AMP-binding protein [Halioxenophilus aromaticivorans]|uniref:Xanthomonadin biosynthesis 3-hydroxybenozate--AMP ligase XanA2 n=1 Tax=Halioxenophilus aromaticivorans TaxID=1306992 RepID=A0AAV3TZ84_9ALTE